MRGRPPKVAFRILSQTIENGGLKATNLEYLCKSLKMSWVKRIGTSHDAPWRRLLQARVGKYELNDMIRSCLGIDEIKRMNIPKFYKDIFADFQMYTSRPLDNPSNIQREAIWYNRSIRNNGRTFFHNGLYQAGVKIVDDLLKPDGNIMTLRELKNHFPRVKVDFLTYAAFVRKIPQMWKDTLSNGIFRKLTNAGRNEM